MSVAHELRLFRIQTLQRAYRAHQSDLPLLEERIGLLRDILAHYHLPGELDPNPVFLAKLHYDIGYSLYERHMHLKDIGDLEHAESHLRLALADLASGVLFPGPHSVLGSVLRECAYILEDSDRAKEAVLVHRPLLPNNGVVPPLEQAYHARELGRSLHTSSLLSNHDRGCLFESIACLKRSQALYSEAGVTDHMCAFGLSFASSSLYAARTNKSHLDHAISYGELALEVCGPHHRDVFAVKSRLEYLRLTRIEYFSPDDQVLDRVIDTLREALVDAPSGWVVLLTHSLAYGFGIRCSRQGHKDDLSEAIAYTREAMFSLAANDPSQCRLQSCLSGLLFTRFKITGIPQDIEAAACAANMAVSNAVARTGNYFAWLNNLAACRATQYTAFGDLATLDECITLLEQIMQSAPLHGSGWKLAASNMLEALQHRYQATRTTADLDRAMQMVHLVLEYKDEKAWMSPMDLHNAGIVFLSRFEVTNASEDLDRATALLREAAEDHTIDTHMSHEWKGTYARVLRLRAEALHDEPCATEALEIQQQIVTSLPDVHPDRAQALCGLARLQLSANSSADTVADSLTALLHALNNHQCPAYRRLKDVSDVLSYLANHPVEHDHATQVSMVYSTAIALLPEVASFGLNPSARLAVMSGAGSLTTQGAIHSISIGQLDVALEMLEAGRNVFWTQNLQLRTSFMHLPKTVADKLTKIAYALARPMPDGLDVPRRDRELAQRRQAGDDFRSVLNETRLIPGFEGLLRNASFASIVQAAARHPIVVFVADETSGHAIIIQSEVDCRLVKLLHATTTSLQKLSGCLGGHITHARSSRGMRKIEVETHLPVNVYQEVWTLVMRPVVEALQWPKSKGQERRRLTLCPTGAFMQLPLHAAGIYSGDAQVSCSNYFVASYTPSIAALLHAQQSVQPVRRTKADMLLVAVDRPIQGTPLPMASKESNIVQRLVSPLANVVQIARCDAVFDHIQSATIVHLACHGTQNPANALESSFHLEDGLLPVSRLMELELPSAFLAVLSACETAKGDVAQPDQAIHLASAMLFAGFKSVVATMWFMGDAEGPEVAEGIYSALFKQDTTSEYLDPDDVPYALDEVVQKLRWSGLDPSFWATYVHIGI